MADILIIEDDPDFAMSLELVLGLRNLEAVSAKSAEDALSLIEKRQGNFHLVFMDIKLPGMDGIACLEEVHSRWPDIKCIIMTGFRDKERIDHARSAGATDVLLKPFGMDKFLTLIEQHC